jgi:hypothetical protein
MLTIPVLDGANRPATSQLTLTATDPAPAPVTVTSPVAVTPPPATGGGGGLESWTVLWLTVLVLWSQRRAFPAPRRLNQSTP